MKKISLFAFALALGLFSLTACGDASNAGANLNGVGSKKIDINTLRAAKRVQNVETFSLSSAEGLNLETLKAEALQLKMQNKAQADDAALAGAAFKAMMSADNSANALDVKFSMSDEPIENGVFVFALESPNSQDLTLEIYDEEGFEVAANNKLNLTEGNNYKALNVKSLEGGEYMLRLRNEDGKELNRAINIKN